MPDSEEGSVAGELPLLLALFSLLVLCLAAVTLFQARNVVEAAAQDGAHAGAAEWGTAASAIYAAERTIKYSPLVELDSVTVEMSDVDVEVEVRAIVNIPYIGWKPGFAGTSVAPQERVVRPSERSFNAPEDDPD